MSLAEFAGARDEEGGISFVIDGLTQALGLSPEGRGTKFRKWFLGGREIELGDQAFDGVVYVQGSPPVVRALLDVETRRLVKRLLHGLIEIGDASGTSLKCSAQLWGDRLQVTIGKSVLGTEYDHLEVALGALVGIARRLAPPDDLPQRLATNARTDPVPAVRLHNLVTLVREYPEHPATREALRVACADESDEIRLRAAMALGEEGHRVLLEMAAGGELGRGVNDQWSAGAVAALGEHLPRERAEAILEGAVMARRPRTARECVRALGRMGGTEVIEPLARALFTATGEVAAEVARALGATGLSRAEGPLLEALARGLRELRVPVAEALGRVGSVKAVPPLREAEARYGDDRDLRYATRQAIAEIQSRLAGASPGQLSLAEGQAAAGQLSLADAEAGRLSLAQGEAKGPSSPRDGGTGR